MRGEAVRAPSGPIRQSLRTLVRTAPYLVLFASLALTVLAWNAERVAHERARAAAFTEAVEAVGRRIEERLAAYENALRGGAVLLEALGPVTRDEWRAYAYALEASESLPAIRGFGFVQRVTRAELDRHETHARSEGMPDYAVHPPGERLEYGAILYLEPHGARALGYDLYTDPIQRAAMFRARDAGAVALSGPQNRDTASGPADVVMYLPVMRRGKPVGTLVGWVFSPIAVDELMRSVVPPESSPLDVRIYDGLTADEGELLYASTGMVQRAGTPGLQRSSVITLLGRPWTMRATALPAFEPHVGANREWWLLAGGLALSLLVFAISHVLVSTRDRALALAGIMTEQWRRANEHLENRVASRTRELAEANRRMQAHIAERELAGRERVRALAQEEAARKDAEAANRTKDEFQVVLSHELRTPLNAIQGWAHILGQDAVAPEAVRRGAAAIKRNVAAQQRLIESLLDSSRMAVGQIRLEVHRVRLADVAAEVVAGQQSAAAAKGVTLRCDVAASVCNAEVMGDPRRLAQIVGNLVSNALKFTPPGGAIGVHLDRSEDRLRLTMADTGTGISSEFLPHVFDPFRQADSSSRRRAGGLGLGLALVKQLVELHGGTIEATSPGTDRGTTLVVLLPEAAAARQNDDANRDAMASVVEDGPPPPGELRRDARETGALAGCALLVVDDHADTLEVMRAVLERQGARVTTASTVPEALEQLQRRLARDPPSVILCDIELPGEDGYALLEQLRSLETRADTPTGRPIPVLAVTAYAGERHRNRALAAGFDAHVTKPVDPRRLVGAIHAAWRRAGEGHPMQA